MGKRLGFGEDVSRLGLRSQCSFGLVTVPVSLAVLFESVLHRNLLAEDVLSVQVGNCGITAVEVAVTDKAESLARTAVFPGHLGDAQQRSKAAERIVQNLLVDHGVQVSDEQLGAHLGGPLLVGAGLVDAQGLAVELDAVHDIGRVLGVGGGAELDEAEALVGLGDAIARHVDVVDGAHLEHDFVDHGGGCALVDVADIDGGLFVLLPAEEVELVTCWPAYGGLKRSD